MRIDVGDGLHLNVIEEGKGVAILQIFGPGSDAASGGQSKISMLADRYRVIVYDTRGGGDSDWADWYSMKTAADDAASLLNTLNIDKAVVYGGSNGAIVALYFALRHRDKALALILDGSSAAVNFVAAKNWRNLALRTIQEGRDVLAEATGAVAGAGLEFKIDPSERVKDVKVPDPKAQFAMLNGIADLYDNPLEPQLKDIMCPTLILIGENDKLAGVGGSVRINRNMPGSTLRILKDSGHTVVGTTPDVAREEINTFLDGVLP